MAGVQEKVTAFVIRPTATGYDLLFFLHHAGSIQLPAGTVEPGEEPRAAALREAREETGLADLTIERELGTIETPMIDARRAIQTPTSIYARPTVQSADWARLRRGIWVRCERRHAGFVHITYAEWDRHDQPSYISYQITGWAPETALADVERRHFYLLTVAGPTRERWEVFEEGHHFSLFWASLAALPAVEQPQAGWLTMLPAEFRR